MTRHLRFDWRVCERGHLGKDVVAAAPGPVGVAQVAFAEMASLGSAVDELMMGVDDVDDAL